jgi:MarR family transcriptional regulator, organic hydroperoxide resistance regulator
MNKIDIINDLIQAQGKIRNNMILQMKQFILVGESITPLQIEAMMLLLDHKQLKMSELAKFLNLKTSGATQLINTLVIQNKVIRKADTKDNRVTLISLTPNCTQKMKKMKLVHNKAMINMFDHLDQNELQTLLQITQKITSAL